MDLSICIPSRNEMFLARTVEDILANLRGDAEIIITLDGQWADPPVYDDPRVHLIYLPESVGQRAAVTYAARLSTAKYVMKVDGHCSFDEGFDVKLMEDMQDDWTMAPVMKNLHVFDWVCRKCGNRTYQGPTPIGCKNCDNMTSFERDIVWIAKRSPNSASFCFDPEPHFGYFGEYSKRPEAQADLTESMSLQGSCFLMRRDKYFELGMCDEAFGGWGSLGIEISAKTWLSGGRVIVSHKTWYAHLFRTSGGDFGFPYPLSGNQVEHAKRYARELFFENKWPKQIHPLSWLVERFWPVRGWSEDDLAALKKNDALLERRAAGAATTGILYYTCLTHLDIIETACRAQLQKARNGHELGSVSRGASIDFGDWNIVIDQPRSALTMHLQILAGLERMTCDYVFLCESDVLYHPSHFDFVPPRKDTFYYNTNIWKARYPDGHAVWTDDLQQVSGLCADRELLLGFYRRRVAKIEREGFDRHYEPGPKLGDYQVQNWQSALPNLDIRHSSTLTASKWSPDEFRNRHYARGWKESNEVEGWGITEGRLEELLKEEMNASA